MANTFDLNKSGTNTPINFPKQGEYFSGVNLWLGEYWIFRGLVLCLVS